MPIVKAAGKAEMKFVLSHIKDHNSPEVYKNTLQSLYGNFTLLKHATIKSKTNIDDGIVDLILDAVKERADSDSILLLK